MLLCWELLMSWRTSRLGLKLLRAYRRILLCRLVTGSLSNFQNNMPKLGNFSDKIGTHDSFWLVRDLYHTQTSPFFSPIRWCPYHRKNSSKSLISDPSSALWAQRGTVVCPYEQSKPRFCPALTFSSNATIHHIHGLASSTGASSHTQNNAYHMCVHCLLQQSRQNDPSRWWKRWKHHFCFAKKYYVICKPT